MNEIVKKSVEICGFWFHIEFNGDEGKDQHDAIWINPDKPRFKHESNLNLYLDAYNEIQETLKEYENEKQV